jgi:ABC-type arginine/histidine transport system permease subunit
MLFPLIFTTPEGKVTISLPETIYQRDVVTGVIALEPSGNTETKRKAQLKKLKSYDLVISNKATSLAGSTFE